MANLLERYKEKIDGVLSCYDRVVITGTLPQLCYAAGMTGYLHHNSIRIFDYFGFSKPFRAQLVENAERLAKESGIKIQHIKKKKIKKEKVIAKILKERGHAPGLVHIISAVEPCNGYRPWHNKSAGKTYLLPQSGSCLHYYFYFIDEEYGLGYVRVPTWCPFRLQVYFNGHNWLASKLKADGIEFSMVDNAFDFIADYQRAQQIADNFSIEHLHRKLDQFAQKYCPVHTHFKQVYHWSVVQAEFATDIIFKRQADLQYIYDHLFRTAVHTVKADNIATFLAGKQLKNFIGEVGNRYNIRVEGARIKHTMGEVAIKMYDKFKIILRIETTVNNLTFFKHYRTVEHRDGTTSKKYAAMKKNIYSLVPLQKLLLASNRRYLEFISAFDDQGKGPKNLWRVSQPVRKSNRKYRGFNFFDRDDLKLLLTIIRGEFNISGFRNRDLKKYLTTKNTGQISRLIKSLRMHGLIRKAKNAYKYYLTKLGKKVIATALKIKELVVVPKLA